MIAGMVLTNLLYVVGAIAVATIVSGFVLLRHRRPKSLEAGIEMFSRELKALEPDRPGVSRPAPTPGPVRKSAVRVAPTAGANRDGASAPSPDLENESG